MCKPNDHKYRKLNENQLFCAKCADVRTVSGNWTIHSWGYRPVPWYPALPYWANTSTGTAYSANVTNTSWGSLVAAALEDPNAEEHEESDDRQD